MSGPEVAGFSVGQQRPGDDRVSLESGGVRVLSLADVTFRPIGWTL